jgi:phosphoribosylamine---glycine ligase
MSPLAPLAVLLVGSGGREHALAVALAKSPLCQALFIAPGNPGMANVGQCVPVAVTDCDALVALAKQHNIGLVVIGPEAPLAAGLADQLQAEGIPVFGPTQAGAQLEASKAFAKVMMDKAGVPTARHVFCATLDHAISTLADFTPPYVIKQDGLAAGKGVTIAATLGEAKLALEASFAQAMPVVIEDFLHGEELSVLAICDGQLALPLVAARDYKKVYDGDQGPNTGGMGSFCPVPNLPTDLMQRVQAQVLTPMMHALNQANIVYKGVLYAGLMIAPNGGIKVIEFNARFGDPETQSVLALLDDDLVAVLLAAANGDLTPYAHNGGLAITPNKMVVTVVLASKGYPDQYPVGLAITLPETLPANVQVFQAGTGLESSGTSQPTLVTNGGRVLNVTATANTLAEARALAYQAVKTIQFEGCYYRTDIATITSPVPA